VHLVDDDDAVRDSLRFLIESYGLDVREHSSAVDFLQQVAGLEQGCVVLDLNLPVLSGLDLITIMRERGIRFPVVFITGRSDEETRARALKSGAVAFLDKPVREDALMEAVDRALASRSEPSERPSPPPLSAPWQNP
jgi:two-component system response regulator FixJ